MSIRLPLQLLGRPDCEICEALYHALMRDSDIAEQGISVIDIDAHPALQARYHFRIPVLMRGETELWAGPLATDSWSALVARIHAN